MAKNKTINVQGSEITIIKQNSEDFISMTDMIKPFGDESIIKNWLRNRNTVEFLGIWEQIYNPDFNPVEFDQIRKQTGLNSFVLSAKKWIESVNAKGIVSSAGRYGGTFAHRDIAFEFGSWLSPEFKLYLIREFQRLKEDENDRLKLDWNLQRTLSKINYRIHTDAIKETLVPPTITKLQAGMVYASEADMLNVALFGITAKQWRDANPTKDGNIRDYAELEQLVVLTNLESINSVLVRQQLPQTERLMKLNEIAITQMRSLLNNNNLKKLKEHRCGTSRRASHT